MAVSNLETLCAGFCEFAGVPTPELEPNDRGIVAFHFTRQGVIVDILHSLHESGDNVFVLFNLGSLGADVQSAAHAARQLLGRNFASLNPAAPTFACNPATGNAFIRYVVPFFETSPLALHELVQAGIAKVVAWRETASAGELSCNFRNPP